MIRFQNHPQPEDFVSFWRSRASDSVWIVSSHSQKQRLRSLRREAQGFVLDHSVVQMQDWAWQQLLAFNPSLEQIPEPVQRAWVKKQLSQHSSSLLKSSPQVVLELMRRLPTLMLAEMENFETRQGSVYRRRSEGDLEDSFTSSVEKSFVDWLNQSHSRLLRLGGWWPVAMELSRELLKENCVLSDWVVPLAAKKFSQLEPDEVSSELKSLLSRSVWDLGRQMQPAGVDLLQQLGRLSEPTVIVPPLYRRTSDTSAKGSISDSGRSSKWVQNYELLGGPVVHQVDEGKEKRESFIDVVRTSSVLAEVKTAVAKVREWIEGGSKPEDIALISPDPEGVWPILLTHLREEGIAIDKREVVRAASFPQILRWLGQLRSQQTQLEYHDLELALFADSVGPTSGKGLPTMEAASVEASSLPPFAELKMHLENLMDQRDLDRASHNPKLQRSLESLATSGVIGADPGSLSLSQASKDSIAPEFEAQWSAQEFIAFALKLWVASHRDDEPRVLSRVFEKILLLNDATSRFTYSQWLEILTSSLSLEEISSEEEASGPGVLLLPLHHGRIDLPSKAIFINLSESFFQATHRFLDESDLRSLQSELGHWVNWPPDSWRDEELWEQLNFPFAELLLLSPATSLSGDEDAPHPIWQWMGSRWGAQVQEVPPSTRIDEGMINFSSRRSDLVHRIQQDRGEAPRPQWSRTPETILSATSWEKLMDCRFQFVADRWFRLADKDPWELTPDALTEGVFVHELLLRLLRRSDFAMAPEEVGLLLDELRKERFLSGWDESLWPAARSRYIRLSQKFLAFEREWRLQFPGMQIAALEQDFHLQFAPGLKLRGKIDRVEKGPRGEWAIVDYKSSITPVAAKSWIENNKLQLLLYRWALENKAIAEFGAGESVNVIAALYWNLRKMDRTKGLRIRGVGEDWLGPTSRSALSVEDDRALRGSVDELLKDTKEVLRQGDWSPKPRQVKLCEECDWRTMCRAPHLP